MARQQLGTAPTNDNDVVTKGFVEQIPDLTVYTGDCNAVGLGTVYVNASVATGTPGVGNGIMETWNLPLTSGRVQTYTSSDQSKIYVRYFANSSWTVWTQVGGGTGGTAYTGDMLKVQAANPALAVRGLWIETKANGDISFWVENGL